MSDTPAADKLIAIRRAIYDLLEHMVLRYSWDREQAALYIVQVASAAADDWLESLPADRGLQDEKGGTAG